MQNNILNKTYQLSANTNISAEILRSYIKNFWFDIYQGLHNDNPDIHLLLMCKVGFNENSNTEYKTVGPLRKVNFGDRDIFIQYLLDRLGILSDSYNIRTCTTITFTYVIKEGIADRDRELLNQTEYEVSSHNFNNLKLPLTMDTSDYGRLIATEKMDDYIRHVLLSDTNRVFTVDVYDNHNEVRIEGASDFTWTDTMIDDNTFKRTIGKNTLYIRNGEVVVREKQLSAKPFTKVKTDKKLTPNTKFMTMDIETINISGNLVPYLICGYSPNDYIEVFTNDVNDKTSRDNMFRLFIDQIVNVEGLRYVYAHNLSNFDGVMLLNYLVQYPDSKTEPIMYNGKLICIKFTYQLPNSKPRTITFKDSLLMLPMSLRSLSEAFDVDHKKGFFPVLFNDIGYKGRLPAFKLWGNISHKEYNNMLSAYSKKQWSFMEESLKYCRIDCIALFEVLTTFNQLVFDQFNVNIHKSLTLPL